MTFIAICIPNSMVKGLKTITDRFYGHSLPSADSRRAIVSFWQKNVHNTG